MRCLILMLVMLATIAAAPNAQPYQPNWESIDSRPVPAWFDEAKFGIFIHWGVYSAPSWGPKGKYAEWYWSDMMNPEGKTRQFHNQTYGADFLYQDFAPMFKAELFNPDEWADIFQRSGAKYVALTSKHHEGFCLWPSPDSWNWNSVDIGPHRDLCGDLTNAVKAKGLKMGFYYSLYEWFNPIYRSDVKRYVDQHMLPQIKDLVTRYEPSIIFSDGEWDHPSDVWRSTEFLAWLYNESKCKDEVVVNDRWGKETRGFHGGYMTTEYGNINDLKSDAFKSRKWEESRGMGASYGYNRNESIDDYKSGAEMIHLLVEIVAKGGNLLLDIGPTGDGRIPVIMQQRLLEIGKWLSINGEAIYGTKPWRENNDNPSTWYTQKDGAVYVILNQYDKEEVVLEKPVAGDGLKATLLEKNQPVKTRVENGKVVLDLSSVALHKIEARESLAIKLEGVK